MFTHIYTGGLAVGRPHPLLDQREVELPVLTKHAASFNGQTAFKKAFAPAWHSGPFTDVFRELEQESKPLLQLSIPDATRILEYLARRPTAQFELFGVKIPTARALTLGIPMLLGLQFYLWAYLKALSMRLVAETAFKEYAWVGFFEDRASRAITELSILVLPPLVQGLLLFREAVSLGESWLWLISLVSICCSVILARDSLQHLRTTRKTLTSRRSL